MAFLLFVISFLVPEILKFSYYANLVTDDIISCASTAVWHKIKNISANNEAMLLKLRRNVAPYEIYQMVHIVMLLWQHAQFQSLLLKNQILPFVATRDKINMSVKNAKEETLWRYFALVSHKIMVKFHFEEAGDWNQAWCHSNIKMCTTWYIS